MKTKLGVLLYSCHVNGHRVHFQPPSKGLLVNNSENMARYTFLRVLLYPTLLVCFVTAMSQIIYEKRKKKKKESVPLVCGELDFSFCLLTEFVNRAAEFDEVLLR